MHTHLMIQKEKGGLQQLFILRDFLKLKLVTFTT